MKQVKTTKSLEENPCQPGDFKNLKKKIRIPRYCCQIFVISNKKSIGRVWI